MQLRTKSAFEERNGLWALSRVLIVPAALACLWKSIKLCFQNSAFLSPSDTVPVSLLCGHFLYF